MTMTTKELLALVEKATLGPWRDAGAGRDKHMLYADVDGVPKPVADVGWSTYAGQDKANAALIVAAVNALPALCAEVEALRKDAERLDWLQRAARTSTVHMGGQHPWNLTGNHKLHNLRGPDLRAAIDAARSRNEREG